MREGFAGVKILYKNHMICIDVKEVDSCTYIFYTHDHERHFPREKLLRNSYEKIYSIFTGNILSINRLYEFDKKIMIMPTYAYSWRDPDYHPREKGSGFIIKTDVTTYHTGDSELIKEMSMIKDLFENIYVLFIPIEGRGVFTPEEASELVRSLRPSIVVPIHYEDKRKLYLFRDLSYVYSQVMIL